MPRWRFRLPWRFALAASVALPLLMSGLASDGLWGQVVSDLLCPAPAWPPLPSVKTRPDLPPLRAATYNLHAGLGPDWRPFTERVTAERNLRAIARHLAAIGPAAAPVDAVSLNEVDFGSRRTGWFDQADFIASELSRLTGRTYHVIRGETWRRRVPGLEVRFGNALLVRHPVLAAQACRFDQPCAGHGPEQRGGLLARLLAEPRGLVRARIDFHGREIDILSTHLEAVALGWREAQAAKLVKNQIDSAVPTLLLGDVNTVPFPSTLERFPFSADRTHDILTSGPLVDSRRVAALRAGAADLSSWASYPARHPEWPLDGVFASPPLFPERVEMVGAIASDHRGVAARFGFLADGDLAAYRAWSESNRARQLDRIRACHAFDEPPREQTARLTQATGYY